MNRLKPLDHGRQQSRRECIAQRDHEYPVIGDGGGGDRHVRVHSHLAQVVPEYQKIAKKLYEQSTALWKVPSQYHQAGELARKRGPAKKASRR